MVLAAQHLDQAYGAVVVLRDVSLIVNQGDRVGLVGANGAGKSTLLLDEPTNYISLDTLETCEAAVLAFPGPVVAVSHDRAFMERCGGDTLTLADGQVTLRPVAEYLADDRQ